MTFNSQVFNALQKEVGTTKPAVLHLIGTDNECDDILALYGLLLTISRRRAFQLWDTQIVIVSSCRGHDFEARKEKLNLAIQYLKSSSLLADDMKIDAMVTILVAPIECYLDNKFEYQGLSCGKKAKELSELEEQEAASSGIEQGKILLRGKILLSLKEAREDLIARNNKIADEWNTTSVPWLRQLILAVDHIVTYELTNPSWQKSIFNGDQKELLLTKMKTSCLSYAYLGWGNRQVNSKHEEPFPWKHKGAVYEGKTSHNVSMDSDSASVWFQRAQQSTWPTFLISSDLNMRYGGHIYRDDKEKDKDKEGKWGTFWYDLTTKSENWLKGVALALKEAQESPGNPAKFAFPMVHNLQEYMLQCSYSWTQYNLWLASSRGKTQDHRFLLRMTDIKSKKEEPSIEEVQLANDFLEKMNLINDINPADPLTVFVATQTCPFLFGSLEEAEISWTNLSQTSDEIPVAVKMDGIKAVCEKKNPLEDEAAQVKVTYDESSRLYYIQDFVYQDFTKWIGKMWRSKDAFIPLKSKPVKKKKKTKNDKKRKSPSKAERTDTKKTLIAETTTITTTTGSLIKTPPATQTATATIRFDEILPCFKKHYICYSTMDTTSKRIADELSTLLQEVGLEPLTYRMATDYRFNHIEKIHDYKVIWIISSELLIKQAEAYRNKVDFKGTDWNHGCELMLLNSRWKTQLHAKDFLILPLASDSKTLKEGAEMPSPLIQIIYDSIFNEVHGKQPLLTKDTFFCLLKFFEKKIQNMSI